MPLVGSAPYWFSACPCMLLIKTRVLSPGIFRMHLSLVRVRSLSIYRKESIMSLPRDEDFLATLRINSGFQGDSNEQAADRAAAILRLVTLWSLRSLLISLTITIPVIVMFVRKIPVPPQLAMLGLVLSAGAFVIAAIAGLLRNFYAHVCGYNHRGIERWSNIAAVVMIGAGTLIVSAIAVLGW